MELLLFAECKKKTAKFIDENIYVVFLCWLEGSEVFSTFNSKVNFTDFFVRKVNWNNIFSGVS